MSCSSAQSESSVWNDKLEGAWSAHDTLVSFPRSFTAVRPALCIGFHAGTTSHTTGPCTQDASLDAALMAQRVSPLFRTQHSSTEQALPNRVWLDMFSKQSPACAMNSARLCCSAANHYAAVVTPWLHLAALTACRKDTASAQVTLVAHRPAEASPLASGQVWWTT